MNDAFLTACERACGGDCVGTRSGMPVISPLTTEMLCDSVRLAAEHDVAMAVAGSGTFPDPEPSPTSVMLSTARLTGTIDCRPDDFVVVAPAGTSCRAAMDAVGGVGQTIPFDIPGCGEGTLGGAYMTGAEGMSACAFGPVGDAVLGVNVVAGDGSLVTGGGMTMKHVTGFDLPRFFAGTRGLFGIAASLTLKTRPLPERCVVVTGRFASAMEAANACREVRAAGTACTLLELTATDGLTGTADVHVGLDGYPEHVERSGHEVEAVFSRNDAIECTVAGRADFSERHSRAVRSFVTGDTVLCTVPPAALPAVVRTLAATMPDITCMAHAATEYTLFGGVGETNYEVLRSHVMSVGGKGLRRWDDSRDTPLSAMFSPAELKVARELKRSLDPANLLNPHLGLT